MKRLLSIVLALVMSMSVMAGCGNQSIKDDKKIQIVTTIFPVYDWVKNLVGDSKNVEVTMLLDNGADLHSFQPTAEDILTISRCDAFVYVGGESDEWVEDALEEKANDKMEVISLMDELGDKAAEEQEKEGMQADDEEEEEEEAEYDEHIWLSLKNASALCESIAETLKKVDAGDAQAIEKNKTEYINKINQLDQKYEDAVAKAKVKTLVFADRFPLLYMTNDYGLDYFAAFKGCSAETEASFKTIKFLANKIDELALNNILVIEGTNHKIADTVARATKSKKKKILVLDSMQSITGEDAKAGETYTGAMEKNLEVLEKALANTK